MNLDDGVYRCDNDGCDFRGRIDTRRDEPGVSGVHDTSIRATATYVLPATAPKTAGLGPGALQFLRSRKIDPDIARKAGVHSVSQDTAIAIPYHRDGEVVHVKYRSLTEKRFWSSKGTEHVLYNLDGCKGALEVIIVEGELDALALMTVGIGNVLSVPNGAVGPGQHADGKLACLTSGRAIFEHAHRVLIAVDMDVPGIALREELVRRIGAESCHIVSWPDGAKDANETLMRFGTHAVQNAIEDVSPAPSEAPLVSAQTLMGNGLGNDMALFRSPRQIAMSTGDEVDWLVPGIIARGGITDLVGKVKSAGKTTFMMTAIRAVLDGGSFLGQPCTPCPVVYLTEQSDSSLKEALRRAGLLDHDHDLCIMSWHRARSLTWPETVAKATKQALHIGAGMLVVDTVGRWAGVVGDSENDAGAAMAAMEPLKLTASGHDLAVVTVRHGRKSGGEIGDDGRGSSAYGGEADIMLSLRRAEGNHASRPNVRELQGIGRYEGTPERVLIELQGTTYALLGNEAAVVHRETRDTVSAALPTTEVGAKPLDALCAAVGGKRTTVQRVLKELTEQGRVKTIGSGKRGDPARYWRQETVSAQTAGTSRAEPNTELAQTPRGVPADVTTEPTNDPAPWELNADGLPAACAARDTCQRLGLCRDWLGGSCWLERNPKQLAGGTDALTMDTGHVPDRAGA